MFKPIDNLGGQLFYETPGTFALITAGIATYISSGDLEVRDRQANMKDRLKHWSVCSRWGKTRIPLLVAGGTLSALAAYAHSKEPLWLVGAGTLFAIVPFSLFLVGHNQKELAEILEKTKTVEVQGLDVRKTVDGLNTWDRLHFVRLALALGSAAVFFLAKIHSQNPV